MSTNASFHKPPGIILAGGLSRRMGREKALLDLGGVPVLRHAIDRLTPQVSTLVLSANGDVDRFAGFGLEVVRDQIEGHKGPLAGILSGMLWAQKHAPGASHILSIAADTPFFPVDLVAALQRAVGHQPKITAIPRTGGRLHPAFGLWPVSLAPGLTAWLASGEARVHDWLELCETVPVEFAVQSGDVAPAGSTSGGHEPPDPFFNINEPDDLLVARSWIEQQERQKIRPDFR